MKNIELAKKIKVLRNRKGLSQDELATTSQLNLRTIQRIESAETEPRGDTLKRLATALQVTPDDLIDWTEEEDTTMLMYLNISALSFIVFPLLGVIIPLVLWLSKKDKIKNVNLTGKKLLNFQISLCLFQLMMITAAIFQIKLPFQIIPGIGFFEFLVLLNILVYLFNILLIVVNTYRSYKNKPVWYKPAIPFLR